ncbi:MAG: D-2-hydroxyacid dehydrogenase [Pseudomonadota bacterium]
MKAVFLDYGTMGPGLDLASLEALIDELVVYDTTADSQIAERIRGANLVFTNKIRFTAEVLEAAPELAYIGLTATGSDNIDLEGAARAGVVVSNIRAYCTPSVNEHVFGVVLMLTHRLKTYDEFTRAGGWQAADDFCPLRWPISELAGKTLGIVGFGDLGRGVASVAEAFGMNVIVSARPGSDVIPAGRVSLATLLADADVVSLHCPLNDATRGLMGADELRQMKRTAILVNTARGGLVDSQALADALARGDIAAAAIDVLPIEPPRDGDPLLDYAGDNLVITPHIAWGTTESRQNAIDQLADNARAFLNGEPRNQLS